MNKKRTNLQQLLGETIIPKKTCKTASLSNTENNNKERNVNSINSFKNGFKTFKDYMAENKDKYWRKFLEEEKKKINNKNKKRDELIKIFNKNMPYISGKEKINKNSFHINSKLYFINKIRDEALSLINKSNSPYPIHKKYGLAYLFDCEWLFFSIDEIFYQKYISDSKNIFSILYKDYNKNITDPDKFFSDNDKYILPKNITGLEYEKNSLDFFELATNLEKGPDIMFKLFNKNNNNIIYKGSKNNNSELFTFDDYINNLEYNFVEIDGSLINKDKKMEINLINNIEDCPYILYDEIIVISKMVKNDYIYDCKINKNLSKNVLKIAGKSVIFFQTKISCPLIQINPDNIKKKSLTLEEIKKELVVVIYKMILSGNYFYELYKKIKIIDDSYNVIFYLIFNSIAISDISDIILKYINKLNDLKYINYPFSFQPIFLNSAISSVNKKLNVKKTIEIYENKHKIEINNLNNEIDTHKKEINNLNNEIDTLNNEIKNLKEKLLKQDVLIQELLNKEFIPTKVFDNDIKIIMPIIKKKIEEVEEKEYSIFEPMNYKCISREIGMEYTIKIKIAEKKYIHVNLLKKKENENIKINEIIVGKSFEDVL